MKKLLILFIFLVGCTNNEIKISEKYVSCIDQNRGQYVRNTVFNKDNCESVIAFIAKIDNATPTTKVKLELIHKDKVLIETTTTEDLSISKYPTLSYSEPAEGFSKGDYSIKIYVDDNYNSKVDFKIE